MADLLVEYSKQRARGASSRRQDESRHRCHVTQVSVIDAIQRRDLSQAHGMRVSLKCQPNRLAFQNEKETSLCASFTVCWRWPASDWRHAPTAAVRTWARNSHVRSLSPIYRASCRVF